MLFSNWDIIASSKNLFKIGVLDNIGLFITIGEGIEDKDGNNLKEKKYVSYLMLLMKVLLVILMVNSKGDCVYEKNK